MSDDDVAEVGRVTEVGLYDIGRLLSPKGAPRHGMRGFDPDYADIVDYIVRCTHRIWEEKAVGLIYSHYRHNAVVHTPMGTTVGRDAVVASTLQTLLAFPDRRLYADAVIWSGDDATGYYSSHRITNTGTNLGPTAWGDATGRRCVWRGIADCVVLENRVVEEWLVRDDMHLCRQLGFDPDMVARTLAAADAERGVPPPVAAEPPRLHGQFAPSRPALADGADAAARLCWFLDEMWNGRMLNRVAELYAPGAVCHAPGGRELRGANDIAGLMLQVLAALPNAAMTVAHVAQLDETSRGTSVAVRWMLQGNHDGPGLFGPPTGAAVAMMGISHYRVVDGRVAEEWTVFDELAARKQIMLATGG